MLEFSDLPYQFVEPRPNALIIALIRIYNRVYAMPSKEHLLTGIDLTGLERFLEAKREPGARFVLMPNHPTHSDPNAIVEICRRAGVRQAFMTAYDVFARKKFDAWIMQRTGAFSVDREGSDRKSMKCAAEILAAGKYPPVVFAEGNVYLHNDRVSAFSEGAAYIALRAQKALGTTAPVYAVPISLKFTYVEDVRDGVRETLAGIAKDFGTEFDREAPITDEIIRISSTVLGRHLKDHGYDTPGEGPNNDTMINEAAGQILDSLEAKMELRPKNPEDLTGRVRKVRAAIHAIRTDQKREEDHPEASQWANEAMLALRILGYSRGYATENPTLDRIAETVARLQEDITSKSHPPFGKRRVLAEICEPIDLRDHLKAFSAKARPVIESVTTQCEEACQAGLDRMNAANSSLGAQPF